MRLVFVFYALARACAESSTCSFTNFDNCVVVNRIVEIYKPTDSLVTVVINLAVHNGMANLYAMNGLEYLRFADNGTVVSYRWRACSNQDSFFECFDASSFIADTPVYLVFQNENPKEAITVYGSVALPPSADPTADSASVCSVGTIALSVGITCFVVFCAQLSVFLVNRCRTIEKLRAAHVQNNPPYNEWHEGSYQ
jgi:hypothetical protein